MQTLTHEAVLESGTRERPSLPLERVEVDERAVRSALRRRIAELETELCGLFTTGFPRRAQGVEWRVGAAGGPRVLGIAELERTRDALLTRIAAARATIAERADREEEARALIEEMVADPAAHRFVIVSNEDLGEAGCKHFHSRPRFGILGMLLNWWRVKVSSGCPLARGRAPEAPPAITPPRTPCAV